MRTVASCYKSRVNSLRSTGLISRTSHTAGECSHSGSHSALFMLCPTCSTEGAFLYIASSFSTAMYSPCDSLNMFFLRSTIFSPPAGVIVPMSPVWNQPSESRTSDVFSGCRKASNCCQPLQYFRAALEQTKGPGHGRESLDFKRANVCYSRTW